MKKTAVVYWSGTGNTEAMAKAVAEGMESAGAQVTMLTPDQVKASELSAYDAIAFGCPAMGSEVLEEMELQPWRQERRAVRFLRLGRRRVDARLGKGLR